MKEVKISAALWEALRALYLSPSALSEIQEEALIGVIKSEVKYKDSRAKTREKYLLGKFGKVSESDRYSPPFGAAHVVLMASEGEKERPEWITEEMRRWLASIYGATIPENMKWLYPDRDFDPT